MWIQLSSRSHQHRNLKFAIDELPVSMGRSPGADVTIDDELLSRNHCELSWRAGDFIVRDLESTNGTAVNGLRITESALVSCDVLTIGTAAYEVLLGSESATQSSAKVGTVPDADLYPKP